MLRAERLAAQLQGAVTQSRGPLVVAEPAQRGRDICGHVERDRMIGSKVGLALVEGVLAQLQGEATFAEPCEG